MNQDENALLLIDGVAKLINDKPLMVVAAIEATTGKRFVGRTFGQLTESVGYLLKNDPKFGAAMGILVLVDTGAITADQVDAGFIPSTPTEYSSGGGGLSAGGFDMVSSIVSAVGNITSGSLQLAAAKANAKGAKETASLNLEAAKTNQETLTTQSKEGTKQALLQTLGAKYSSQINPTSIAIVLALLVFGGIGIYMLSRPRGAMPAITPPTPAPAPPSPPAAPSSFEVGGQTGDGGAGVGTGLTPTVLDADPLKLAEIKV